MLEAAGSCYEAALAIFRELGDGDSKGWILGSLGTGRTLEDFKKINERSRTLHSERQVLEGVQARDLPLGILILFGVAALTEEEATKLARLRRHRARPGAEMNRIPCRPLALPNPRFRTWSSLEHAAGRDIFAASDAKNDNRVLCQKSRAVFWQTSLRAQSSMDTALQHFSALPRLGLYHPPPTNRARQ